MSELSKEEIKFCCKVGDHVVYKKYGICIVEDIRNEKIMDEEKLYYVLQPLYGSKSKVFLAVDSETTSSQIHPVLTKEELDATIDETEALDGKWINEAKKRQAEFEKMLSSGNRVEILWLVKALSMHKESTENAGKKFYASDERVLAKAVKMITEEFAYVLKITPDEVVNYILKRVGKQA